MIAVHFENLVFLLLIAFGVLFQLLTKAASRARREQTKRTSTATGGMPPAVPHAPTESDAERIRKFLEALGQPVTSRPPPPVVPRTDIPPRPMAPVRAPIGPFSPAPWQPAQEKRRKGRDVLSETPHAAPPVFEVHEVAPHKTETVTPAAAKPIAVQAPPALVRGEIGAISLLRSSSGLRNAVILREILGPPRGLTLELIGSA